MMAASPGPDDDCMVPEEGELQEAIFRLTSTEKEIINTVLQRDDEVRSQEKERLRQLKRELDELQELGVPEGREHEYGRVCTRCRTPLGAIANRGALCPRCQKRVCKGCQKPTGERWICTLCSKEREIRGESGEWFYGSMPKKKKTPYGSTLIKRVIKRRKSQAYKLSKSRRQSEDDTLTSCEIEYTISETFKKVDRSDQEYVVVDQDQEGAVSVSEGKVSNIPNFGSEAGGLSSVSEENGNEASLSDVAFTSNVFHDFDYDRSNALEPEESPARVSVAINGGETEGRRDTLVKLAAAANPFLDEDLDNNASRSDESIHITADSERKVDSDDEEASIAAVGIDVVPPKPVRGLYRSTENLTAEEPDLRSPEKPFPIDNDLSKPADHSNDWATQTPREDDGEEKADVAQDMQSTAIGEANVESHVISLAAKLDKGEKEMMGDVSVGMYEERIEGESSIVAERQHSASTSSTSEVEDDEMVSMREEETAGSVAQSFNNEDIEHQNLIEQSGLENAAEENVKVSLDFGPDSVQPVVVVEPSGNIESEHALQVESSFEEIEAVTDDDTLEVLDIAREHKDKSGQFEDAPATELGVAAESAQEVENIEKPLELLEETKKKVMNDTHDVELAMPAGHQKVDECCVEHKQKEVAQMSVKERAAMFREMETGAGVSAPLVVRVGKEYQNVHRGRTTVCESNGDTTGVDVQQGPQKLLEKAADVTESVGLTTENHILVPGAPVLADSESAGNEDALGMGPQLEANVESNLGHEDFKAENTAEAILNEPLVELQTDVDDVVGSAVTEVVDVKVVPEESNAVRQLSRFYENQSEDKMAINTRETDNKNVENESNIETEDLEVKVSDRGQGTDVSCQDQINKRFSCDEDRADEVAFDSEVAIPQVGGDEREQLYTEPLPASDETASTLSAGDRPLAGSYESLNGYQSDEGDMYEALRPHVKVAGEVVVGLKYDSEAQRFEVQIHRANGLLAADSKKNTSDPYVKTYLEKDGTRAHKKKTKVKKHNLDPVFDEIITYKIDYEELLNTTVIVSVWHNDMFGQNIFLGESEIAISSFVASGYSLDDPTPQQYPLTNKRTNRSNLKDVGDIIMELMYVAPGGSKAMEASSFSKRDPVSGQLVVRCIECKNLTGNESTNPFCEVRLLPCKSNSKEARCTTEIEARTLNPFWDKEFTFENVTFSGLSSKVLEVKVLDASVGKRAGFLGAVRLGGGQTEEPFDDPSSKECAGWQKMLQEPNKRISLTLPLRSTLESLKGSATLPPILVEREEEIPFQVRDKKSDSILSQSSAGPLDDDASILKTTLTKSKLKPQPDLYSLQSFGSMLSIYSDAGGYGSVPVSGEILFSIQYDNIAGVFEVHVQKAKNIAAVNKKTRASDPYVKTYLLPDKSKESKKKTNFKRKTVNPNWDEKIKYKIGEKDVMKRTLQVSVWNHEKFGQNDFLGEAQVRISQYVKSGHNLIFHEPIWYTLQEAAPVSVGESGYKGSITIGLKFETIDDLVGKLLVDIKEASDLAAADPTQLSNPFVKAYLLPDRSRKSKRKSTFKKGTLSPSWNEKFEYNGVSLEELGHRVLELTVWDHDLRSNDFLGGTRLGLGRGDENWHDCIGKEASIWNAMLEHPGIWVEYTMPLRDSMTSRKGADFTPPDVTTEVEAPKPVVVARSTDDFVIGPVIKRGDSIKSKINIENTEPLVRVGLKFVSDDAEVSIKRKGTLLLLVKEARNLPFCASGEMPTTYCKCYLRPRRSAWRFKTGIFKRSIEPVWGSEFAFEGLALEDMDQKCLDIIICSDDNEGMGMARLGPGVMQQEWDDSRDREVEIWTAMVENPDSWNFLMIPLRMQIDEASSVFESEVENADEKNQELDATPRVSKLAGDKKLSAKDFALQAMGSDATKVINLMGSDAQETKKTASKATSRSQDALPRTLSLIREEDDGEERQRVKFADRAAASSGRARTGLSVPTVVITEENEKKEPQREIPDAEVDIDAEVDEVQSNLEKMKRFGSRDSIASMTSVYSTTSNVIMGIVPVKGQIQFCTKYDFGGNFLEVHILRARDIAAVDAKREISDPYVKLYLLPDKSKASKRKTKVKHKTLNPLWNEILTYKISLVDLRLRTLMVSIWNYDRLGRNIFLGEVLVPMDEKTDNESLSETTAKWYDLEDQKVVKSPVIYKGSLTVGLMFETGVKSKKKEKKEKKKEKEKEKKKKHEKGRIMVHVIKGEDLPAADQDGLSDPYCKFYLLPSKAAKTKRKTPVIRKTRSAFWDYFAEYDADQNDLPELGIEFTVYDYDPSSRNDFLGCSRVNLGGRASKWHDAVGGERELWKKIIEEPDVWHEQVLPLRSSSDQLPDDAALD